MIIQKIITDRKLSLLILSVIIFSSISTVFADIEMERVGVYCDAGSEPSFSGSGGTYLEICPINTDLDIGVPSAPTLTKLTNVQWGTISGNFTAPIDVGLSNVTGYLVARSTNGTFFELFNDTGNTNLYFSDENAWLPGVFYQYAVAAWNNQGLGSFSNVLAIVTPSFVPDTFCKGVSSSFEIQSVLVTADSVELCWDLFTTSTSIPGYAINYTSPWDTPNTIIIADTMTNGSRSYLVENLQPNTKYSFNVKALNEGSVSNRLDIITLGSEFDIGSFTVNTDKNPNSLPFFFTKTLLNGTQTQLDVDYDNTLTNVTCDFRFQFAQTNQTYNGMASNVQSDTLNRTTFIFNGIQNDVVTANCYDGDEKATYVITQETFPLIEQIQNFRNGTYGTAGQFGTIDLISLFAIILSMIAFNRVNAGAGAIFTVIMVGALASLNIITWPVIVLSAIALVVLLAVITHSRDDVSE